MDPKYWGKKTRLVPQRHSSSFVEQDSQKVEPSPSYILRIQSLYRNKLRKSGKASGNVITPERTNSSRPPCSHIAVQSNNGQQLLGHESRSLKSDQAGANGPNDAVDPSGAASQASMYTANPVIHPAEYGVLTSISSSSAVSEINFRSRKIPPDITQKIKTISHNNEFIAAILQRQLEGCQLPLSMGLNRLMDGSVPEDTELFFRQWYRGPLLKICPEARFWAREVLKWVVFALEPLTLQSLAQAIELKFPNAEQLNLNMQADILEDDLRETKLLMLFRIDDYGEYKTIKSIHDSFVDFLLEDNSASQSNDWFRLIPGQTHREIAEACLTLRPEAEIPLQRYAHKFLEAHLQRALSENSIQSYHEDLETWKLLAACELGLSMVVERFDMERYFNPPFPDVGRKAIALAAAYQDSTTLRALLKFTSADIKKSVLFLEALQSGGKLLSLLLQEFPYLVDSKIDSQDSTPLHIAVKSGAIDIARELLSAGANFHARDKSFFTPLAYAAASGRLNLVELLVKAAQEAPNANKFVSQDPEQVVDPLAQAAANGHIDVMRLLLECPGSHIRSLSGEYGSCPLHHAAEHNQPKAIKELIDLGSPINLHDLEDWTPLHVAAFHGSVDAAKALLEYPEGQRLIYAKTEKTGSTPLYAAAQGGHLGLVQLLIEFGASPDERDWSNSTPLHAAAFNGHLDCVRYLLEKGADPEAKRRHLYQWKATPITPKEDAKTEQVRNEIQCAIEQKTSEQRKDFRSPWSAKSFGIIV